MKNEIIYCKYGCGREAKYFIGKNGDTPCCEPNYNSCPAITKKTSKSSPVKPPEKIETNELCFYCKENKAEYKLQNNRLCCQKTWYQCPRIRKGNSENALLAESGKPIETDHLCDYGCKRKGKYIFKNGKYCCESRILICPEIKRIVCGNSKGIKRTPEQVEQMSLRMMGKNKGKKMSEKQKELLRQRNLNRPATSEETRKKLSKSLTRKFDYYVENHPIFVKLDEPIADENGYLLAKCKNSDCNKYFKPNKKDLSARLYQLRKDIDGCFIYCSDKCKNSCSLYNVHGDPNEKNYEKRETLPKWLRNKILERDNYECQICGSNCNSDLIIHHITPVKINKFEEFDIDNLIVLCSNCHNNVHKDECSVGNLAKLDCKAKEI